jgi:hypothetical protein
MCVGLHIKGPLLLSDFNHNWNSSTNVIKTPKYKYKYYMVCPYHLLCWWNKIKKIPSIKFNGNLFSGSWVVSRAQTNGWKTLNRHFTGLWMSYKDSISDRFILSKILDTLTVQHWEYEYNLPAQQLPHANWDALATLKKNYQKMRGKKSNVVLTIYSRWHLKHTWTEILVIQQEKTQRWNKSHYMDMEKSYFRASYF